MLTYADVCLGHRIDAYRIHAGKCVPIVKGPDYGDKMEENEWYSLALLVQKYLLTGTKVQILTPEKQDGARMVLACFTGTKVLACWYKGTNTDT